MPKIGLLADSHGRADITRRAIEQLAQQGAQRVIHLGDVGTTGVIDALAIGDSAIEAVHIIFGNTDWDIDALAQHARKLDIVVDHPQGQLAFGAKHLVYTHGDDQQRVKRALASRVDYFCHGHTHRARDERIGRTRVINPGALFRAAQYSVAILDTDEDDVAFYPIPRVW